MKVVNDDKKWKKFVNSFKSNLELLQQGTGKTPDVADIFGVNDPKFANIMQSIGTLENDIEKMKTPTVNKRKRMKRTDDKKTYKKKKTYQATTAAL